MKRLDYPFTIRPLSKDEGGGYLIEFPDLPGCISDGATPEEAIRNGADAARGWISAMRQAGRAVPRPSRREAYSGKWQMRVPRSLHRKLAERARAEGVSLNTLVVTLVAEGLGQRQPTKPKSA
jgi:antitoxin HicB